MQKLGHFHNVIITGLAKAGNIAEAYDLFKKLKERGQKHDSACYNSLIIGLSLTNKRMEAYEMFVKTCLKGCRLSVKNCMILLDALHRAGNIELAAIVRVVLKESKMFVNWEYVGI